LKGIVRGLTTNVAETDPSAEDARLRGRTYAIPFDDVWNAALSLSDGGLRGCTLVSADDQTGTIHAESTTILFRFVDDVRIRIKLDDNAQTRVDVRSASRKGRGDLGVNTRRIGRFFRRLDKLLGAKPDQILDPTLVTSWSS
jgi:hypothetical protein